MSDHKTRKAEYMIYTYDIKKTIKKNNGKKNSSNARKDIDAIILSNLKSTIPYIFGEDKRDNTLTIDFSKPKKETKKKITIDITHKPSKPAKPTFDEFIKAFNYLTSKDYSDTYDFLLDDGTPIKMFDDEIQIGLNLIPLTEGTKFIYDALSDARKKEIIDIYINIKK